MLQKRHPAPAARRVVVLNNASRFVRIACAALVVLINGGNKTWTCAAHPSPTRPNNPSVQHPRRLGAESGGEQIMSTSDANTSGTFAPANPGVLMGTGSGCEEKRKGMYDELSTSPQVENGATANGIHHVCQPTAAKRQRTSPVNTDEHASLSDLNGTPEASSVFAKCGVASGGIPPQQPNVSGQEGHEPAETAGKRVVDNDAAAGSRIVGGKREDYIVWDDYFMSVAFLSAMRSKDPSTQVGACIVNQEKRIVGIGYNGFPMGCSDDRLPWNRVANDELDTKYPYVCHAEMNAILNKNSADVKGCLIYVALFPCNECAKLIIQSGIKEVVYLSDKYHRTTGMKASRRLFELAGIRCRQYVPKKDRIVIDFSAVPR